MPLGIRIEGGIVRAEATGVLSAKDILANLPGLVADPEFRPGMPQLLDLTGVEDTTVTADELRSVISDLRQAGGPFDGSRLAIAADSPALFGMARMYEAFADLVPVQIHVHRSREEALAWLRESDPV